MDEITVASIVEFQREMWLVVDVNQDTMPLVFALKSLKYDYEILVTEDDCRLIS